MRIEFLKGKGKYDLQFQSYFQDARNIAVSQTAGSIQAVEL